MFVTFVQKKPNNWKTVKTIQHIVNESKFATNHTFDVIFVRNLLYHQITETFLQKRNLVINENNGEAATEKESEREDDDFF